MDRFSERRYALVLAAFILTISLLVAGGAYTLTQLGRLTAEQTRATRSQARETRAREREARVRQHENCQLFRRFHSLSTRQLRDTRHYLRELRPGQGDPTLNRAIAASLPKLEAQVRVDVPPRYCNSK